MSGAYEIPNLRFSGETGEAIPRRRFVTIDADEKILVAGTDAPVIGVSADQIDNEGEAVAIYDGIVVVEAAADIEAGAYVVQDANGKAIVGTNANGIAVAMTAGKKDGLVSVKI